MTALLISFVLAQSPTPTPPPTTAQKISPWEIVVQHRDTNEVRVYSAAVTSSLPAVAEWTPWGCVVQVAAPPAGPDQPQMGFIACGLKEKMKGNGDLPRPFTLAVSLLCHPAYTFAQSFDVGGNVRVIASCGR